jgi:hypothetical protein
MSNGATVDRPTPHGLAWSLDNRRDSLRAAIYLGIVSGNKIDKIDGQKWIDSRRAEIKLGTFRKWWAEELEKFEREQAARASRIPPNTDSVAEGK